MSSLAGMGFATMWVAAEQLVWVPDFASRIPQSFPVDRFQKREQLERGPLSVGSPGNLAGWCALRDEYDKCVDELLPGNRVDQVNVDHEGCRAAWCRSLVGNGRASNQTLTELPSGRYISVCVTDTGTGLAPGVIAQAFDPFFTTKPGIRHAGGPPTRRES